ncbi:MAG TPA: FAD-dependent oxidoreductase, partial [Sphingomicrobium sp.]|nr:FAD-dependent oxidoreductase [Sphingomicrobium sp.]
WSDRARAAIEDAAQRQLDVLILGTSLTMVDVALSLAAAGQKGRIVALSRRGKIPLRNNGDADSTVQWDELPNPRIRAIARWLRRRGSEVGWRSAVDSVRPHSHRLWQSLPQRERRLFLRYGRPWWDIHRHRVAPEVGRQVDELLDQRRLEVIAGRLLSAKAQDGGIEVSIRKRGQDHPERLGRFHYVFNCTGPLGDISRTRDPLLRDILDKGLASPDELAIGLEVDERSRAGPGERLWALGTLSKGRYWEMIAVPDIRNQAAAVAEDIATELGK